MIYKERNNKKKDIGHEDWWDRSCTKKKRKMKRTYRRWRKRKGAKEDFIESRKRLRAFLIRKRKEKRKEEEVELKNIKKNWKYGRLLIGERRKRKQYRKRRIERAFYELVRRKGSGYE